eukprot:6268730-Pyramimonas_sp.AAC.1
MARKGDSSLVSPADRTSLAPTKKRRRDSLQDETTRTWHRGADRSSDRQRLASSRARPSARRTGQDAAGREGNWNQ